MMDGRELLGLLLDVVLKGCESRRQGRGIRDRS